MISLDAPGKIRPWEAPNLGIRGVGMSASGFGGGLEEVTMEKKRDILWSTIVL